MILAAADDQGALIDFLHAHHRFMMFPLTNLLNHGMGDGHPRAMTAWIAKKDDQITDAVLISHEGMVFPCCPNENWQAVAAVMKGRTIKGLIGEGGQVAAMRWAIGLTRTAPLDVTEPAFALEIADMKQPNTAGFSLHPLTAAPFDLLVAWRADYQITALNAPEMLATPRAAREIKAYIAADSHRVLCLDGVPVAMTGFNAQLPDVVQIGGVYTPPELRSRGYARVALGMHLAEVALDGVTQAVLSAANDAAARSYIGLGFQPTGPFAIVVFEDLQVAHG